MDIGFNNNMDLQYKTVSEIINLSGGIDAVEGRVFNYSGILGYRIATLGYQVKISG